MTAQKFYPEGVWGAEIAQARPPDHLPSIISMCLMHPAMDYFREVTVDRNTATETQTLIGFGAVEVTKPYEFIGFGAVEVTKPYELIGFGAVEVTKPYEFIGLRPGGQETRPKTHRTTTKKTDTRQKLRDPAPT